MFEGNTQNTQPSYVKNTLTFITTKLVGFVTKTVFLVTELAVVLFIGSTVGTYYSAKGIQADCQRVNLAKIGDVFVQCTIVEPKKVLSN
jgi:hypothetical protein